MRQVSLASGPPGLIATSFRCCRLACRHVDGLAEHAVPPALTATGIRRRPACMQAPQCSRKTIGSSLCGSGCMHVLSETAVIEVAHCAVPAACMLCAKAHVIEVAHCASRLCKCPTSVMTLSSTNNNTHAHIRDRSLHLEFAGVACHVCFLGQGGEEFKPSMYLCMPVPSGGGLRLGLLYSLRL